MQLEDGGLNEIHAKEAVVVKKVGHGSVERTFSHFTALAVVVGQDQVVHVVKSEIKLIQLKFGRHNRF